MTPNYDELGVLLGTVVQSQEEAVAGAGVLRLMYPGLGIVVTRGDMEMPNDLFLEPEGKPRWLAGRRIESTATHGTGCAFSSALACGLADGHSGYDSAIVPKQFVEQAILRAPGPGRGRGPMNLRWPLEARETG